MIRWLWICVAVIGVMWLCGCSGSGSSVSPGEGHGTITDSDFTPLGSTHGSMDLKRFTVPSTGTYQCILSAGPRQPALPKPWIRLLAGHVYATNQSFFAAYANGAGVLAQNSGDSIAQVVLTAEEGDQFTFIFSSKSGGTGAYSWRVVKM
mgnify:CR=1 FL=1